MPDLTAIKAQTLAVYERQAQAWDQIRDVSLYEKDWLTRLLADHPCPARVLDLGCGSGRPIGQHITALGHQFTGIDASPAMIEIAKHHLPAATWHVMDIRDLSLHQTFDIVLSWDGFFHLSEEEQRAALPHIAALVQRGGNLLLTVGPDAGEVTGTVAGETVYHASLSPQDYQAILAQAGFQDVTLTPNDASAWGRSILFARNKA